MRQLRLILVPNCPPTVGLSDVPGCQAILAYNPDQKNLGVKGFGTLSKS